MSLVRKIYACFVVAGLTICTANAQQRPQYTQYIFNNYIINPAISGIESYTDMMVGYRNQWSGLQDAPVTSYLSVHKALGNGNIWGNSLSAPNKGDNPLSRSYLQTYSASEPHHGVGLSVVYDKAGPISRLDANASYAYHLRLNERTNLSVGVAAGVTRITVDVNRLNLENPGDPALGSALFNQLKPDLSLGLWLYGADFFAGISAMQVLPQKLSFTDNTSLAKGKDVPHLFLTAGYKLYLDEDIAAIPSVMVKYVNPVPLAVDGNIKLAFKDRVWVGAGYRANDAFMAMVGCNIGYMFNVSYSYDFTTSNLRTVSKGTHEIVLGLLLNNIYKVTCPQHMW